MNILLFLNRDLESNYAFHLLKEELFKHNFKVYYTALKHKTEGRPKELLKLKYFRKTYFFEKLSKVLKANKVNIDFEFFGEKFRSAPIKICNNPNSKEFLEEIKNFEPDLFISIRYSRIFKDEIISIPKKGIINLHSGILPDYRGLMGTLHAIKNGQKEVGCTLHYISDKNIDTGEIIDIASLEVDNSKSLFWHILNLYPLGCNMILKNLQKLYSEDKLVCQTQDTRQGKYFSILQQDDVDKFMSMGFDFIKKSEYIDFINQFTTKTINPDWIDEVF